MKVFWLRLKRGAAAASESLMPLLIVVASATGLLLSAELSWLLYVAPILFLLWVMQTWLGYVRKTHDPTWALKYLTIWDSPDGYRRRRTAAEAIEGLQADGADLTDLKKHGEELSKVDDALDMLEDIGFYVLGEQISPESAHHHFYWWIQGYWCCTHDYITAVQTDGHDPTRWQNIKPLFEITSKIELQRARGKLSAADLCLTTTQRGEFLAAEKGLPLPEPDRCCASAANSPVEPTKPQAE